ncbi:MAG: adenosylhomocysteinase [Eubacteriales bacterium]|nr:adenosylhomocysteinase [Eubacteriales bacterium]
MEDYIVKDIALAPSGHQKIKWVKQHMPLLSSFEEEFAKTRPFEGVKISLSIHMEAKTAYLCKVLAAGGAQLAATGSNSLSTQDDVAAALAEDGLHVYAVHGIDEEGYFAHIEQCLSHKPNIIIDDGGDLVGMVHSKRPDLAAEVWGGCEETTTGIIRLKAMEKDGVLRFPMVAVNDADCKHLFDNRYGTGQSVWDSIMRNTNLLVASKTVVVCGYGWCGRGVAMRAAALGARVIVTEINPIRAMEAKMDGYAVMKIEQAAPEGDFFISVTGCCKTIPLSIMEKMKDGAILCNAGHFNCEVDMDAIEAAAVEKREARKNIMGYRLPTGQWIYIIGEGKLVNIAAADGHPAEIMDLSFAVQIMSALYVKEHHSEMENKVIDVSDEIDDRIARRRLAAWGVEIDTLTPEQADYLASWKV